nr:DUF2851 family protein [Limisphaera ngatamarikiensis]
MPGQSCPVPKHPDWYFRIREQTGRREAWHEDSGLPTERLLQAIWMHQRILRDQLQTCDGRRLEVLHPGFPRPEGGPDFEKALFRVDGGPVQEGDVEVDIHARGWRDHGHDLSPRFARVLLHVVWESGDPDANTLAVSGPGRQPPFTLALKDRLDAPLEELLLWLDRGEATVWPEALRGACHAPLTRLPPGELEAVLEEAGLARFEAKLLHFQARARAVGWEQALWEGLFRGLGYKHNTWPMQWLAERRHRWWEPGMAAETLQARLLGLSGLLPEETRSLPPDSARFLRKLWDIWWRDRGPLADCCLPRNAWRLHGVRPANHPERRLALAAYWLAEPDWVRRIEQWGTLDLPASALVPTLLQRMQPGARAFWSRHWTLRSGSSTESEGWIGAARVTELAVNVVLPWLGARARAAGHDALWERVRQRYLSWPSAADNAAFRLARQRLLGGRPLRGSSARAALQQGLIQILRDFCDHANARCEGCPFPAALEARGGSVPENGQPAAFRRGSGPAR